MHGTFQGEVVRLLATGLGCGRGGCAAQLREHLRQGGAGLGPQLQPEGRVEFLAAIL